MQTCATCRLWKALHEEPQTDDSPIGECRALSPVLWFAHRQEVGMAVWPFTKAEDWCGEFKQTTQGTAE